MRLRRVRDGRPWILLDGGMRPMKVEDFWKHVDKSSDCWIWKGCTAQGYGFPRLHGNGHVRAHRLAWELTYGLIPQGKWVLHHCDNPPCVRPDHLFLGTVQDNMRDAALKGRMPKGA